MNHSTSSAFVGIDVGGTNMRFALVDQRGKILYQERQPTNIHFGLSSFHDRLIAAIEAVRGEAAIQGIPVSGVGLGVPGLISNEGHVHSSVNLRPLEGINLRNVLTDSLRLPVYVVNDANASAYGEKTFGAGRGLRSLLLLTLGTGVGSGLILNDLLWTGTDGCAGEYGHATVEPEGRLCGCGNNGCLEQYASATAIVSAARRALERGAGGLLEPLHHEDISAETVARAARDGDHLSSGIMNDAGRYIGIAAATVVNLLNIDAVIISGGVAASFDLLEEPIRREIQLRAFGINAARVSVLKGTLGDDAGILGSAALAMVGS